MSATGQGPIALLVANLCNLNNGAIEQVRAHLEAQPLAVRAQFAGRCAELIGAATQKDAEQYTEGASPAIAASSRSTS